MTEAMAAMSEEDFAAVVDAIAADPQRREQLTGLLREEHPIYDQRGTAAIIRMRGWILLALARVGVSDAALIFVLEELDTGVDAYLVAAAARALQSYPRPSHALAPFVMRALNTIRYRDEPISFETYGAYAVSSAGTSPVRELLATLAWLGTHARGVVPELEQLRTQARGKLRLDVERTLHAIRSAGRPAGGSCCGARELGSVTAIAAEARRACGPIEAIRFEDHAGAAITFGEFFRGQPSIVVFFYTRCDNPMKCSLTVEKLARMQRLLEAQGLAERIRTAAITYDPAFDLAPRLRVYGEDRGVRLDRNHRMLRSIDNDGALRRHFALGVNFVESLVNRHRVEAYVLDAEGHIAVCFERLHWEEQQVVVRARALLEEAPSARREMSAADPLRA